MYMYIHVYIYIYICICMSIYIYIYINIYIYIYIYHSVCLAATLRLPGAVRGPSDALPRGVPSHSPAVRPDVYICMCVNIHISLYIYIYIYMYICMYNMYIYIYIYIYNYRWEAMRHRPFCLPRSAGRSVCAQRARHDFALLLYIYIYI